MTSSVMFVLPAALLVVCCLQVCCAQTLTDSGVLGRANAARLTVEVDNWYGVYWNGEFVHGADKKSHSDSRSYGLMPVDKCNYPNVLAINATGDRAVVDGVIMQVLYGSKAYRSGSSPEIKVALPSSVTDPQWYLNPYSDQSVWASSSSQPTCSMLREQNTGQILYYVSGTRYIWYGSCNALKYAQVYVKLVVPTICNCNN